MRRKAPVDPPGQRQDQQKRSEGKQHRHRCRSRSFQSGNRNTQYNGQGRAQRRAGRHTKCGAVCQRIAKQALHRRAAEAQSRAHQSCAENPGQACPPDDGTVGFPADFAAENRIPYIPEGDIHTAETDTGHKGNQRQSGPEDGRAEAQAALLLRIVFQVSSSLS